MSSVGTEHRGNWNFVGRDVVVLHRLPDSAHCPAGTAADAFVRSAGVRHVVDHDQPRDPVYGKTPWITLNGLDVAGTSFVFSHLAAKATTAAGGGGGDLELTLGPVEKAVSSAMRIMLDENFERCLRMDRYVYNRPCDKSEDGGGCLSDFWKRRAERSAAVAHGIGRMRRVDVEAAGLECLRAASSYLGEKRFVFGAKPTRLDFVLFGYVDSIAGATEEHQVYHRAVRAGELGNLWSHRRRMKERIGR